MSLVTTTLQLTLMTLLYSRNLTDDQEWCSAHEDDNGEGICRMFLHDLWWTEQDIPVIRIRELWYVRWSTAFIL